MCWRVRGAVAPGDEDVLRFEVPVDEPFACAAARPCATATATPGPWRAAASARRRVLRLLQARAQRLSLEQFGDDEPVVSLASVVEIAEDVGVEQSGERLRPRAGTWRSSTGRARATR